MTTNKTDTFLSNEERAAQIVRSIVTLAANAEVHASGGLLFTEQQREQATAPILELLNEIDELKNKLRKETE